MKLDLVGLVRILNSGVRGTAILEFVYCPADDRMAALKIASPWVPNLPSTLDK